MGLGGRRGIHLCALQNKVKNFNIDSIRFSKTITKVKLFLTSLFLQEHGSPLVDKGIPYGPKSHRPVFHVLSVRGSCPVVILCLTLK